MSSTEMIYRIIFIHLFVLFVCVHYLGGTTSERFTREAENDVQCQDLKQSGWNVSNLRNVSIDLWPWSCLQAHYPKNSLQQEISKTCPDIYTAATKDDIGFLQYYLEKTDFPTNVTIEKLLKEVAKAGKIRILKYLIEQKNLAIQVNDTSLLLCAAFGGNVDLLKYLIYDKNLTRYGSLDDNDTALHYAVIAKEIEMVRFLVETLKYDVNSKNKQGDTPAHFAAADNNLPILKYLIEKGANLKAKNSYGHNLLLSAVTYGQLEATKYLIEEKHMDFEETDMYARTALHAAARSGDLGLVKYLAGEKKANLYHKDFYGLTLLHEAVIGRNLNVVKYLLENFNVSFQIEARDILEYTVAMEAVRYGQVPILKYLLEEKHANISAVDFKGHDLLHVAAKENEFESVKYLVEEKGFDVNSKSPANETALDLAKKRKAKKPLLTYLDDKMSKKTSV